MSGGLVLDASALVAEFLEELGGRRIRIEMDGASILHAPKWAKVEVVGVLSKRIAQRGIEIDEALDFFAELNRSRIVWDDVPDSDLVRAVELGFKYRISAYDMLYVLLALRLNSKVLTADMHFVRAAAAHGLPVFTA